VVCDVLVAMPGGGAVSMTSHAPGLPAGLLRRAGTAAVSIPLFAWIVLGAPGWVFPLLVVAVAAVALWELARLFERSGQATYGRLGIALGTLLAATFALPLREPGLLVPEPSLLLLAVAAGVVLAAPVWSRERPAIEPSALTLVGLVYIGWFLGHAILLHRIAAGPALVLVLVGVTWVGETAAYLVGSAVGRRPLAPAISPGKTVEGSAAQIVASVLTALLLGPGWLLPEWTPARALAGGLLLGVVGQVGDLTESVIKRGAGVKDAGGLIPGHGGMLDRVDGLLFSAPAFYYYVRLGGGLA
jgi:phosphatidate cytidylyltransferase